MNGQMEGYTEWGLEGSQAQEFLYAWNWGTPPSRYIDTLTQKLIKSHYLRVFIKLNLQSLHLLPLPRDWWVGLEVPILKLLGLPGDQPQPKSPCNWMEVWLPATTKANTWETGADIKECGLFADFGCLEDGGLMSQSPSPHLSAGRGFYKEGERNRTKRSRAEEQNKKIQSRDTLHAD